jgi:hypothetical protein
VGDERAKNQSAKTEQYGAMHKGHGAPSVNPVPIIVFGKHDDQRKLLSYLGVRHIASAQPWDSFAKAVWISRAVTEAKLSTEDVANMIGDKHRTVARLLEGFHFINQLIETGRFSPDNSVRKGRGSNTSYPFSWVYTILGYNAVRSFLDLSDDPSDPKPLKEKRLDDAQLLTRAMFGDRSKGLNSAIEDSRQIGELAAVVTSPEKIELLRQGKSIRDIGTITLPLEQRLAAGLIQARDVLGDLHARLAEQDVTPAVAARFVDQSGKVQRLATEVDKRLREIALGGK